jgi:hypothetical protein
MPFGINQQQGDHDKQSTATDTTVNGNATALSDEQSDQKTWSNETDQTADQSNAQSASDEKTWSHDGGDSSESASQDGTTDDERTWSRDEDESASDDQAEQATGEKTWSHDGGDSSESSAQTSDGTATTDQSSQATGQTSGKNYTVTITADTILQTIATYGSIIGVFTALTYWIDRALKRNKGAKRSKSADQA